MSVTLAWVSCAVVLTLFLITAYVVYKAHKDPDNDPTKNPSYRKWLTVIAVIGFSMLLVLNVRSAMQIQSMRAMTSA